jgi:hypothetical protein
MPKEKVDFPTNTAICVSLAYAEGKKVEGRYGDQYYFTLADDRCMYVPPVVADQIAQLAIRPGQEFTITKAERKNGTRRYIEWLVDATSDAAEPPVESPSPSTGAHAPGGRALAPAARSNGGGPPRASNGGTAAAAAPDPPQKAPFDRAMVEFLLIASDATRYVEEDAGGATVRFDNRDVAALATTMFIQAAREGWLTWKPGR